MSDTPRKLRVIDSPDPERPPPPTPDVPREKLKLGRKQIEEINRPFEARTQPISARGILAENLKRSVPAETPSGKRKLVTRRMRDYWLLLIVGNSPLALEVLLPGFLVVALLWSLLFTVMLTWIMWLVMSDY